MNISDVDTMKVIRLKTKHCDHCERDSDFEEMERCIRCRYAICPRCRFARTDQEVNRLPLEGCQRAANVSAVHYRRLGDADVTIG